MRYGFAETSVAQTVEEGLADSLRHVGRPGFAPALWEALRRATAADNLVILAFRDAGPPLELFRLAANRQVFAKLETTYLAGAFRLDPFHDLHLARAPAGVYRLTDIAPDAFQRSRYFIEYYEETTLVDEITFVAYPSPDVSLNICLGRDSTSGRRFTPREEEECRRIAPLVSALCEQHWADLDRASAPAEDTPAVLAAAVRRVHGIHLSPRQAEVALLILKGHSSGSISLRLGISAQTVKVFRKQLYARCRVSSQAELFALMMALLEDGAPAP